MRRALLALSVLAVACGGDASTEGSAGDTADVPGTTDAVADIAAADAGAPDASADVPLDLPGDVAADVTTDGWPDAGDRAWVVRAMQTLLGRKPAGVREVRLLADMIAASDRVSVARAMMRDPAFIDTWKPVVMDHLFIPRVGPMALSDCYGPGLAGQSSLALAAHVRDSSPREPWAGGAWNQSDLVASSIALGDLSPVYRMHLFAMLSQRDPCMNPTIEEREVSRRDDIGLNFYGAYANRALECIECHNAEYSTTESADPALDRFFPLEGHTEKAVLGSSFGRPKLEAYGAFRQHGVVLDADPDTPVLNREATVTPWGADEGCGRYALPEDIGPDPVSAAAFFIEPLESASVWDVEAALHAGIDALRAQGGVPAAADPAAITGPEALAVMLARSFAERMWEQVMGSRLTLAHGFPRNAAQRELLQQLTDVVLGAGWSLQELLVAIVTHPLFNMAAPGDLAADADPYPLGALFDPFTPSEEDPARRGNGPGDAVHRVRARRLLRMVEQALDWPRLPEFPNVVEGLWQRSVGVYMTPASTGYEGVTFQGLLDWEGRLGRCRARKMKPQPFDWRQDANPSCQGYCGGVNPDYCFCDDQCAVYNDCCGDYFEVCQGDEGDLANAFEPDWVDDLLAAAAADGQATARDVAAALKDRILTEADIDPNEAPLLADVLGVPSLDTLVGEAGDLEDGARRLCGALLKTPQFLLEGVSPELSASEPRLVVGATSYKALCEKWRQPVLGAGAAAFDCEPNQSPSR